MLQAIKNLPSNAGIYQFFDENGTLLYVGKAKNLKNRVKSYFRFTPTLAPSPTLSLRIKNMISQAKSLHYISVSNEHDALILENSLIKQLKPKYNILLRDDKTYPYLYINFDESYPRIDITRKVVKHKNIKYFGPYSSGARDLLEAIYLLYPLVQKKGCLKQKKACLFHQIKRCKAPCEGKIAQEDYAKILKNASDILYNPKLVLNFLEEKMQIYSQNLNFEEAAQIRDMGVKIKAIEPKSEIDFKSGDFDLLGIVEENDFASGVIFFVRDGKIVSSSNLLSKSANGFDLQSLYSQMLLDFYKIDMPLNINTIYVCEELEDKINLETIFHERFGKKISIKNPKIGEKAHLANLALKNAKEHIKRTKNTKYHKIKLDLQEYFELNSYPNTIEVFDNSHLGSSANVGAMVCWSDEGFFKENYRHFHLTQKNEYAQMNELLRKRALRFDKLSAPDLWVIDGGKTLLNLAYDIAQSSGANIDIIAISKEKIDAKSHRAKGVAKDIIHTLKRNYNLPLHDEKLLFLQRLRDEAHRFAISFHRKTKLKNDRQSSLLLKLGLSEAKIKKLILFYGSFEKIQEASIEELSNIIGEKNALKIKQSN